MSIKSLRNGGSDVPSMESQSEPNYSTVKEKKMPLIEGKKAKTNEGISDNISIEKHSHPDMPVKQASAIAYSKARKSGAHIPKSHQRHKEHR